MNDTVDVSALKVLIVDDEQFVRELIKRLLEKLGVSKVVEAPDGADGLTLLASEKPDLVLLDIMMESMNGLQFLKTVRTGLSGAAHDLPVIVLTGSTDSAVVSAAMALDCDAFFHKSGGFEKLETRLQAALSQKAAVRAQGDYFAVTLPDVDFDLAGGNPAAAPASGESAGEGSVIETQIVDLEAGMTVARPVVTDDGHELLGEGTVLTASHIARLQDLSEIIGLNTIYVTIGA